MNYKPDFKGIDWSGANEAMAMANEAMMEAGVSARSATLSLTRFNEVAEDVIEQTLPAAIARLRTWLATRSKWSEAEVDELARVAILARISPETTLALLIERGPASAVSHLFKTPWPIEEGWGILDYACL